MALVTSIVGAAALQGPLLHVPRPQLPTLDTARTTTPQLQWINEDVGLSKIAIWLLNKLDLIAADEEQCGHCSTSEHYGTPWSRHGRWCG